MKPKNLLPLICGLFLAFFMNPTSGHAPASLYHRLVILADMGNEPDEEQQMAHLLMYANKVDLEGLIA